MSSPSMLADPLREIGETVEGIKEALGIAETDHAYYVAGGAPGDLRGLRDFAVQEMRRELCFEAEKPTKHDVAEQLLTLAKLDDAHVLRFLRVSRFKPREAIARAVAYCRWEREQMMLPADLGADPLLPPPRCKPSQPGSMPPALLLRPLLESGCLSILPTPAVDGSAVLLSDLRQAAPPPTCRSPSGAAACMTPPSSLACNVGGGDARRVQRARHRAVRPLCARPALARRGRAGDTP